MLRIRFAVSRWARMNTLRTVQIEEETSNLTRRMAVFLVYSKFLHEPES